MKRLLNNKKGTAEVIGTVLFIVILLFFFTNVYLWHDAATKEMNTFYTEKINSPISVTYDKLQEKLIITNNGGVDAVLCGVWVNERGDPSKPDSRHQFFELEDNKYIVQAGGFPTYIAVDNEITYDPTGKTGIFEVITTFGNTAICHFSSSD
jgi:hypothetical protein